MKRRKGWFFTVALSAWVVLFVAASSVLAAQNKPSDKKITQPTEHQVAVLLTQSGQSTRPAHVRELEEILYARITVEKYNSSTEELMNAFSLPEREHGKLAIRLLQD